MAKSQGVFKFPGCDIWYIRYNRNGQKKIESSGSTRHQDAVDLRNERKNQIRKGTFISTEDLNRSIDELFDRMLKAKRLKGETESAQKYEDAWKLRLEDFFGGRRATDISNDDLTDYGLYCQKTYKVQRGPNWGKAGLSNATINRDLSALQMAYSHAVKAKKIPSHVVPTFEKLDESKPRAGFIKQIKYSVLCQKTQHLPWMRAILAVAYNYGNRLGEILSLKVSQVDLLERMIVLEVGDTKNGEGRYAPMTEEVYQLLSFLVAGKRGTDYVFTREDGSRVRDFRRTWKSAVASDEIDEPGLLFHDMRRSAIRNMVRRGIPVKVAMKISGHKTMSVFERYNIIDDEDLRDAAKLIAAGAQKELLEAEAMLSSTPSGSMGRKKVEFSEPAPSGNLVSTVN